MRFRPPVDTELAYRDHGLAVACKMLGAQLPLPGAAINALYDFCLSQHYGPERLHDRTQVVATSMAFGALLVAAEGFEWVWAESEETIGLAVKPGGIEIAIWPSNMICRRLLAREETTAAAMIQGLRNALPGLKEKFPAKN